MLSKVEREFGTMNRTEGIHGEHEEKGKATSETGHVGSLDSVAVGLLQMSSVGKARSLFGYERVDGANAGYGLLGDIVGLGVSRLARLRLFGEHIVL